MDLEAIKVGDGNGRFMFQAIDLYNGVTRQVAQTNGVLLIDLARELPRDSALYYDYLQYTEPGGRSSGRDCCPAPGAFSGCPLSILQEIAILPCRKVGGGVEERVGDLDEKRKNAPGPPLKLWSISYLGSAASTSGSTLAAYLVKFSRKRLAKSRAVVS